MDNPGRTFANQLHNYVVADHRLLYLDTTHMFDAISSMVNDRLGGLESKLEGHTQQNSQSLDALTKSVDSLCSEVRELGSLSRANVHCRSDRVETSEVGVQCTLLVNSRRTEETQLPRDAQKSSSDVDPEPTRVKSSRVVESVGETLSVVKQDKSAEESSSNLLQCLNHPKNELRIVKCVSLRTGAEADVNQESSSPAAAHQDHVKTKVKMMKVHFELKTKRKLSTTPEPQVEDVVQECKSQRRKTRCPTLNMNRTRSGSPGPRVVEKKCLKRRIFPSSSEPDTEDSSDLSDESESGTVQEDKKNVLRHKVPK